MTTALDMTLDDLIRQNRRSPSSAASRGGRIAGRRYTAGGRASGPARRAPNWRTNRLSPYSDFQKVQTPDSSWEHDLYTEEVGAMVGPAVAAPPVGGRSSAIELGTKLLISNLDYGVSNEDIQELFSEVGDLKRYSINYDRSGRSKGTAEVVFAKHADALAAVNRYDNVLLDGKPMKIEIVGTHVQAPLPLVPPVVGPSPFARGFRNLNANAFRSGGFHGENLSGRGGSHAGVRGRARGGNSSRGGGGGGSKGKRKEQVLVSVDDLDAELEKYRARGRHAS